MGGHRCAIRMQDIHTRFGDEVVHRGISLCVREGERLGLVGGSGSGKTTLLREMIGLMQPTEGTVRFFGHALHEVSEQEGQALRNRCGVLFQNGALFTDLNVYDNVALPLRELKQLDEGMIHELVMVKLAMVGLEPHAAQLMPYELSGGMVKRAALARALALEPELLFLDEPTSGLDPIAGDRFVDLIRGLHRDIGFTMVMITHDLHTLPDLCDRVAVLADGGLVTIGALEEVVRVDHPFVQDFFHGRRAQRVLGRADGATHAQ